MGTAYNPSVVNSGMVLCLDAGNPRSYPGSGTAWSDLSGNGNTGTLTNGPVYDSLNGGSISFDSVDDSVVCASSSSFAFGTGDFSLEMWIYHGTSGSAYTHMFAFPNQNVLALKAYDNGTYAEVYVYANRHVTSPTIPGSQWFLTRNAWNHIVFKRASSVAYAYRNGTLIGSNTGFTENFTAQQLNIGWGWGAEYRSKKVAVARVYRTALSDADVLTNYNAMRGRFGL